MTGKTQNTSVIISNVDGLSLIIKKLRHIMFKKQNPTLCWL